MTDSITKLISLGLGVLALTKDKAEQIVEQLVEQGEITKEEGKGLVHELIKRGEKSEVEIKKRIEKTMKDMLEKLDVPTRKEVDKLKAEIRKLKKK